MSDIQRETRSVRDMLIAAKVLAKDGKAQEKSCNSCKIPVWLSFFFDGTGNNIKNDLATKSQSNVVALFEAHKSDVLNGVIPLYYQGLGTEFSFPQHSKPDSNKISREVRVTQKPVDITDPKLRTTGGYNEKNSTSNTLFGRGFAYGIQERLQKATFDLVAQLDRLYKNRGITEINISIFGFSRGATEARIFCNWLEYAPNVTFSGSGSSKKFFYRGKPLYIKFLGIFDTVESIGWAAANLSKKIYKTTIPDWVEHTMHLTASLEMRQSFPLTPTGKRAAKDIKGASKHEQIVYPGAHSNVGGGYQHLEQGKALGLSRICLHRMFNRARAYNVKLDSLSELSKNKKSVYQKFYNLDDNWNEHLKNFMKHVPKGGNLGQEMSNQISLYHQWMRNGGYARFINKMIKNIENRPSNKKVSDLTNANDELFENIRQVLNVYLPKGSRPKDVLNGKANVENLHGDVVFWFENYVCDSVGGFLMYANAFDATLQDTKNPNYLIARGIEDPT